MKWSRRFRARVKAAIRAAFPPFPPRGMHYLDTNIEGPIEMGGLPSAR